MQRWHSLRWTVVVAAVCAMLVAPVVAQASIDADEGRTFARPNPRPIKGTSPARLVDPTINSAAPSVAGLTFQAIGDPIPDNSWLQTFSVSAPDSFTNLGMMLGFGYAGLEGTPAMDFSFEGASSGWAEVFGPASGATWPMASAMGTATGSA